MRIQVWTIRELFGLLPANYQLRRLTKLSESDIHVTGPPFGVISYYFHPRRSPLTSLLVLTLRRLNAGLGEITPDSL